MPDMPDEQASYIELESRKHMDQILSLYKFVIVFFTAQLSEEDIASTYVELSKSKQVSDPKRLAYCVVDLDLDDQKEIATWYNVFENPSLLVFRDAKMIENDACCDAKRLEEIVTRIYGEAYTWLGVGVPRGYSDITNQVDPGQCQLLNHDPDSANARCIVASDMPATLQPDGKANRAPDHVLSDTDDQLMIFLPFQVAVKLHSLQITSVTRDDEDGDDDDDAPMKPRTIRLYTNRTRIPDFDDAEQTVPSQEITLQKEDWVQHTANIPLRYVRFQNISSLVVFIVDGDSDAEKVRIDRIRLIGDAGPTKNTGKLEKIGDEPGE